VGPGLAELLSLPFRIVAPEAFAYPARRLPAKRGGKLDSAAVRAALVEAVDHASAEFPSLRLTPDAIDTTTVEAFVTTFNAQLQDQVLDPRGTPAKQKHHHAGKTAKPKAVNATPEPDWAGMERKLVDAGARIARAYAKQHGVAAALVLDCDPPASYVLFSFETAVALVETGVEYYRDEASRRSKLLAAKGAWKDAAKLVPLIGDAINPGDFEHMDFDRVDFGEVMQTFARSSTCPESPYGVEPYVQARFRVVLTRAIDQLVVDRALDVLVGEAPLFVGYTFHEEPTVLLHVFGPHAAASRSRSTRSARRPRASRKQTK
jgi:hypothetical protein